MKLSIFRATALVSVVLAVLSAPIVRAQSAAIAVDRSHYFHQTANSTVAEQTMPFSFNLNIRGGTIDMSGWGPAFYKPGSGGVAQSGASSATNTGTLNFTATPNNGGDYLFTHDFATAGELTAAYPNGAYGINFAGAHPPTPNSFSAGLEFATSTNPSATPQITSVNNGAAWGGGILRLKSTGVTTLTLNPFPEYASTTYGAVIGVGIYKSSTGDVIGLASKEAYDLPLGDSTATPTPHHDPAITQFTIDGSWLIPGVRYTIEMHYTVLSGRPEEANLTASSKTDEWQGVASSRNITLVTVMVPANQSDFSSDGQTDLVWYNTQTGAYAFWLMNGTDPVSYEGKSALPLEWKIAGKGDFNGDGKSDLVWTNTQTGAYAFWLMDGTTPITYEGRSPMPLEWHIAAVGDFNGDGKADLVWANSQTGAYAFWMMDGTTPISYEGKSPIPVEWQIIGAGDFNADGQTDLVWINTRTGDYAFWLMNGTTPFSYQGKPSNGAQWQITSVGDFNGDGQSDLVWRNTQTGEFTFWLMNGTTTASVVNKAAIPLEWQIIR